MTTIHKAKIITIPNLLTALRLALIPAIAHLYGSNLRLSAMLLLLSGLSDLLDGWYARTFDAITPLGKALDPIADKLTQVVVLYLITRTHQHLRPLLFLLIGKELICGVLGYLVINHTQCVPGARWHGKAAAAALYLTLFLHFIWKDIPFWLSNTLLYVTVPAMLLSLVLYATSHLRSCLSCRTGG